MDQELDIDARHLVEWLKDDLHRGGGERFEVSATRSFVEEPAIGGDSAASSEDEAALMTAIGVLELRPKPDSSGHWVLRIRVEDVVGLHLPDEGSVPDGPEEMTLEGFEADFILPERGTIFATLEIGTEEDRERFARFARQLEADRHAG